MGLQLIHDEKIRDAMERAHIDAELVRSSQRIIKILLSRNVFVRIRSRSKMFEQIEHL